MFWKYFRREDGYNNKMKVLSKRIEELETTVMELQGTINSLQAGMQQAHLLIKYLSGTQLELSGDMMKIHKNLQVVLKSLTPSTQVFKLPILGSDDDDDDLLN